MRKLFFVLLVSTIFGGVFCYGATSPEDKAKDLVKKAIAYIKTEGKEKAYKEINNPKGKFVDGDFYVFVIDFKNTIQAHGGNAKLIGQDLGDMKDPDGVFLVKDMTKLAMTKGEGWVNYKWSNPVTKKVEPKSSYVKRLEGEELYAGCGVYKGMK